MKFVLGAMYGFSEFMVTSSPVSEVRLKPGYIKGEVDEGELTMQGATLRGWVRKPADAHGPLSLIVTASGSLARRIDLPLADGAEQARFEVTVDIAAIRAPLMLELAACAVDQAGDGTALQFTGSAAELLLVLVGSRADFLRLVQSPTERLKNLKLLFYVSFHGYARLADDFAAQSAAVCVMAYRLLDGVIVPDEARRLLWERIGHVLRAEPNVPRGLWLRWHTSVRLAAGYMAYRANDTAGSAGYFDGIGDFAFELAHWPAATTNVLIGIFLAGWMHYSRREFAEAARAWRRAEGVLRYGGAIAQFPNFYAYGELGNAIKIAQECYIGCRQAENGGMPVKDPRIIPAGYELDIRHLPGLLYNLGLSKQA